MARAVAGVASKRGCFWVCVTLATALSACGVVADGEADDDITPQTSAIMNGTLFNGSVYWRGAVKLEIRRTDGSWEKCSGQVVSRRTILTAAHCLTNVGGNPASTMVFAKMQTTTGWLTVINGVYSFVRYNSAYNGSATNDVGLITVPSVDLLQNVVKNDAAYLAKATPSGVNMVALGYGYFGVTQGQYDGLGRSAQLAPTYSQTSREYTYVAQGNAPQMCKIDSGGPLKSGTSGLLSQYAVMSRLSRGQSGDYCRPGAHWAPIADNMDWLRGKIDGDCVETNTLYACW